jgi:diguanylate cyclase (GGDEF)-like protein
MTSNIIANTTVNIEEVELKGFSRSVAELEWLLLVLVLLYFVSPDLYIDQDILMISGMISYALFILGFHYLNFYRKESRWKIAIETWVMIAFITWVLWLTGKADSPLLNLYLLVIITCGLTLGKMMTLLELLLITSCYLYMGHDVYAYKIFSMGHFSDLMANFAPFLLVAYLTTMLSADLHYARQSLTNLAQRDELTGLFNRRAFNSMLDIEISKATRYKKHFALLLIDIDNLKTTNDKYGHDAGDRLIKKIAGTVETSLRTSDTISRIGGDEFIVLMPETNLQPAMEVAQRIKESVNDAMLILQQDRVPISVSIGVACYPEHGRDFNELLYNADRAMYKSKETGRDSINTADAIEPKDWTI